jgi:hypothetical protein
MKTYFTCSARGTKQLKENYTRIHNLLTEMGHIHVDDFRDSSDANKIYDGSHEQNLKLYKRAIASIRNADVVVLEVSTHSLSMGYLLQQGLSMGKPVIALYATGNKPVFVAGIENEKLQLIEYSMDNLTEELEMALKIAQDNADVRFNFFISPEIGRYLDWICQVKKLPRSVYLRALIERDMNANSQYKRNEPIDES